MAFDCYCCEPSCSCACNCLSECYEPAPTRPVDDWKWHSMVRICTSPESPAKRNKCSGRLASMCKTSGCEPSALMKILLPPTDCKAFYNSAENGMKIPFTDMSILCPRVEAQLFQQQEEKSLQETKQSKRKRNINADNDPLDLWSMMRTKHLEKQGPKTCKPYTYKYKEKPCCCG